VTGSAGYFDFLESERGWKVSGGRWVVQLIVVAGITLLCVALLGPLGLIPAVLILGALP